MSIQLLPESSNSSNTSPAPDDLDVDLTYTYLVLFAMGPPKCPPGAPKTLPGRRLLSSLLFRRHFLPLETFWRHLDLILEALRPQKHSQSAIRSSLSSMSPFSLPGRYFESKEPPKEGPEPPKASPEAPRGLPERCRSVPGRPLEHPRSALEAPKASERAPVSSK